MYEEQKEQHWTSGSAYNLPSDRPPVHCQLSVYVSSALFHFMRGATEDAFFPSDFVSSYGPRTTKSQNESFYCLAKSKSEFTVYAINPTTQGANLKAFQLLNLSSVTLALWTWNGTFQNDSFSSHPISRPFGINGFEWRKPTGGSWWVQSRRCWCSWWDLLRDQYGVQIFLRLVDGDTPFADQPHSARTVEVVRS